MALTHLLDTSVFCQPIKNCPVEAALNRWSALGDPAVCTSAICLAEILQGLHSRNSATYWARYRAFLDNRYPILPFDAAVAGTFGDLAAAIKRIGKSKPTIDLLIAANAKHHGLSVATLNPKEFRDLPGVAVEDWSDIK